MNDDFLKQFRQAPPPGFADELYNRIATPMNKEMHTTRVALGRLAWALGAVALMAALTLAASPAARAWAGELLHQIGPFRLIDAGAPGRDAEPPGVAAQPTAEPPPAVPAVRTAGSALEAGSLAGFTVFTPAELHGYEPAGEWAVAPNGDGTAVVTAYRDPSGDHFLVLSQYRYGPDDRFDQSYGRNETVTDVTVRGGAAIAVTGRLMTDPDDPDSGLLATNWLIWETGDIVYTLYSDALTVAELTAVAESLQ